MKHNSPFAVLMILASGLASSACLHQIKLEDTIDAKRCIVDRVGYTKVKFKVKDHAGFSESGLGGDIDRDGKEDELVRLMGETTVFATNKGCLRDVGTVQGTIVSLVEPDEGEQAPRGLLTFQSSGRCGGLSGQLVLWKMVDHVLTPAATNPCGCPDLTRPDPDRHPLCPRLRPR